MHIQEKARESPSDREERDLRDRANRGRSERVAGQNPSLNLQAGSAMKS